LIGGLPELVRFLPKPGPWMDTFKQIMGFVLMGTVVWIFTFLETSYIVPAVGLLFVLWAACWWIARTPPTAELGPKVRSWLEAAAWVGVMWIVLFPGLGVLVPRGLAEWGFPRPRGLHEIMLARLNRQDDFWRRFTTKKDLARLVLDDKTVMVTFTADWCLNCKVLEATVLDSQAVRQEVQENRVIPVKADFTREDPEIGSMLERLVGSRQVPVLAIFPAGQPKSPIAFVDGYTQNMVLEALAKAGPSK
jgi:thiol:disulfide interchange protein